MLDSDLDQPSQPGVREPPPDPARPLPTAQDFADHAEYCGLRTSESGCLNWRLGAVGAAAAYARIAQRARAAVAPGDGVTVGIIDTGIQASHWEFDSARVAENILGGDGDAAGDRISHGTAVASVIVARRDGVVPSNPPSLATWDFHGVAWGAELKVFAIPLGSGGDPKPYDPVASGRLNRQDSILAGRFDRALAADQEVDILNMSFAYQGLVENYDASEIRGALPETIAAAAQAGRNDADKTLLVWAAGNDNDRNCETGTDNCVDEKLDASSPAVVNALPVLVEELRGHSVSVVATRRDGSLANFSNRCGVAAKWCVAAPGERVAAAYFGPYRGRSGTLGYYEANGTSFAAPLVAGGLAVLKHYFRGQLGNTQLLARLYVTADVTPDLVADGEMCPEHLDTDGDRAACELSSTHGRGLMDLDAATAPIGVASIPLGGALAGARAPAAASALRAGGPAGDALAAAFRGREIAVFDELDAPFWVNLDAFATAAPRPAIEDRLRRFMRTDHRRAPGGRVELPLAGARLDVAVNRPDPDSAPTGVRAALAPAHDGGLAFSVGRGALRASAFAAAPAPRLRRDPDSAVPTPAAGAQLDWRPRNAPLALRLGAVREFESALGAGAAGAFGTLSSGLVFAGTRADSEIAGWWIAADAEIGVAAPETAGGIVRGATALAASAFSLTAERPAGSDDRGRLRLSLSQPLRIESGRLRLALPAGRTPRGALRREIVEAPLAPSGRQIDLAADWRAPAGIGVARLGATLSLRPGHAADRAPELVLLAGYRAAF